jgi:hypothetical protein
LIISRIASTLSSVAEFTPLKNRSLRLREAEAHTPRGDRSDLLPEEHSGATD